MTHIYASIKRDAIRKQLKALHASDELKNAPVLLLFLEYVVEEKLRGREQYIKEYTIGVNALGRPPDFNPQIDAVVRIHANRLRRCLRDYYAGKGKDDAVVIDIPKGGYVPSFNFTNIHHVTSASTGSDIGIIDGSASAVLENENNVIDPTSRKPTLAVFPFHNFSADPTKDYFVSGMGEQLSVELARFQNISIISYYSTLKYGEENLDLKDLQKQIGVDYILTGSVRFTNEVVRINLQLHLTSSSEIIWTETYSRQITADNLFDIQEDITDQVLNIIAGDNGIILRNNVANASPFPKTSIVIRDAIYQYYNFIKKYDSKDYNVTVASLQDALSQEPDNALACAMLSDLFIHAHISGMSSENNSLEMATELAQKAVQLDVHCQHAYKAFAWCLLLNGNKLEAIYAAEHCISLNPKSASMLSAMGLALIVCGEYTKGLDFLVRSMHLSQDVSVGSKLGFALYYFIKKDYRNSMEWLEKSATPMPILSYALQGKLYRIKTDDQTESTKILMQHAEETIDRFIVSAELKNEILDGLRLAGMIH